MRQIGSDAAMATIGGAPGQHQTSKSSYSLHQHSTIENTINPAARVGGGGGGLMAMHAK